MFRKIGIQTFVAGVVFLWFTPVSLATYRDDVPDFTGVLIDQDTTWYKDVTYIFEKEIRIVDGAKLTIQPGTHISFKRDQGGSALLLSLFDGKIDAIGTEVDPIVFDRVSDSDAYAIQFNDATAEQVSVFQYVRFLHGGDVWDVPECPDCGQSFLQKLFIKNVFAVTQDGIETLRYQWGKLHVEDVVFSESIFGDVWVSESVRGDYTDEDGNFVQDPAFLYIKNSDFRGDSAIPALRVMDSSCYGIPFCPRKVNFENNWYAASSGPKMASNPAGTGKSIMGSINFNGFSATEFFPFCATNCFSNVLFLPGLEASRLYRPGSSDNDPLWEPSSNSEVEELFLDSAGDSLHADLYTRDVIDNAYIIAKGNIYKSFLKDLDDWKNTEHIITDYGVAPYDWRLTLEEILKSGKKTGDHISYLEDTDTPYIITELRRLAGTSKSGKVTLIAHSNGGLVAKALTNKLGAEATALIDKIVLVAVPQSGTPQALGALLHGFDQGLPVDWFSFAMSPRTARTMAENMPSGYNLLPSEEYFTGEGSGVETPVVTFDSGALTDAFIAKYGDRIDSHTELHDFLVDNDGKVAADSSDTKSPSRINEGLLLYADNVKQMLDEWVPPVGVAVHQIAGFGEETVSTIRYWTGVKCVFPAGQLCLEYAPKMQYTPDKMIDGDGTVVAPSALAMSEGDNVSRWWVDLASYDTPSVFGREHADILEVFELRKFIKENILIGLTATLPEFIFDHEPLVEGSPTRLEYYLHSPLALSAHDSAGHIISATEDTYPDATYRRFGEVQYLSVPAESDPTLVLDGLADGSFTLEVEEVKDGEVTAKTTFAGIMTSPDTEVTMAFPEGAIADAEPLVVDYDGDGTTDMTLPPQPGETVMPENPDTLPPVTTTTFVGISGSNSWYQSDVTVTLTATDDGSGVEKTEYSFDDGATWHAYESPFIITTEGATTLQYFSTDKSGNKEEMKTVIIKIDKTAPEGKITFNPTTQKLDITGMDNLGGTVTVVIVDQKKDLKSSNAKLKKIKPWFDQWLKRHKKNLPDILATLTDESGHTTSIAFEKTKDHKGYVFVRVQSLGYDEEEATLSDALAQYQWQMDKRSQYRKLASSLRIGDTRLESRYIPRTNETWIMERPEELGDDERDDESERRLAKQKLLGLVVPYIQTASGAIEIKY